MRTRTQHTLEILQYLPCNLPLASDNLEIVILHIGRVRISFVFPPLNHILPFSDIFRTECYILSRLLGEALYRTGRNRALAENQGRLEPTDRFLHRRSVNRPVRRSEEHTSELQSH